MLIFSADEVSGCRERGKTMQITTSTIYNQIRSGLQNFQTSYSDLTTRLATQKKILAPSDDVAGTMRAMDYQVSINNNSQYKNNITMASTNLNLTSTVLTGVSSALSTLTNLTSSSSSDPATLASSAQQAALVRDELYDYANTNNGNGGYLFSGFLSNQQPYTVQNQPPGTVPSTAYVYNGDNGALNVPVAPGATMQANVTGNEAFSLSQSALPAQVNLSNGQIVQYAAGAGTTVNVTILQSDGVTVADTFSFSNMMDMANIISSAIGANNTSRIEAMAQPLSKMLDQVNASEAQVGTRINALTDQSSQLDLSTNTLENELSSVQDANTNEISLQLTQTDTALKALYSTAAQLLPQSLISFLSTGSAG